MAVYAESSIQLNTIPIYTSLLGGHFIYRANGTTDTPASANIIQIASTPSNPSTWGFNTHIGANGIKLRYNENDLSSWTSQGINIYNPTTHNAAMQLSGQALNFYNPNNDKLSISLDSNGLKFYGSSINEPDAFLTTTGIKLVKGGIEAGTASTANFVYLSTNDYPRRQYIQTSDQTIDNEKTYYKLENNKFVIVNIPDISEISNYYEIDQNNPGIEINNYTPSANDPAWREIIGTKFGVDSEGNLYTSNATISGDTIITGSTTITGNTTISGSVKINALDDIDTRISGISSDITNLDEEMNGKPFYQYTTNGTTYDVWYDEEDEEYYYDLNGVKTAVSFSDLDRDINDNLIIVRRDSVVDNITDSINEISTDLQEVTDYALTVQGKIKVSDAVLIGDKDGSNIYITEGDYILTSDTTVNVDKTYYIIVDGQYIEVATPIDEELSTYYELYYDAGVHIFNNGQEVGFYGSVAQIGSKTGFHIEINGTELSFYEGNQKVAYISNQQLYITQSVVLQQMDLGLSEASGGFGQWSWRVHKNSAGKNNLYLKWS